MNHKGIVVTARLLSAVFRPYYMPLAGFVALFIFTDLSLLPPAYKWAVLALVYVFTVFLPGLCVFFYRKISGRAPMQLRWRENRAVPYTLYIISYLACLHLMAAFNMPRYMCGILVSALFTQITCVLINIWWKISMHSAASGALTGALVAYSVIFAFNPVWWLSVTILLSGAVGTARMILRQHSLAQVTVGTLLGVVCGFAGIAII